MGNQGDIPTSEKYESQYSSDSRVAGILACTTISMFFCTAFVLLRLVGRRLIHRGWYVHVSDGLLMVSWIFFAVLAISFGLVTKYGGGRHLIFVTSRKGLQITAIIIVVSYTMSIGFLKLSILALYGSIFPSSRFHQSLWALGVFTALWTSMSVIGAICQCVPIESYWDDSIEGHCIEYAILQLISSVCNITTDFVILFLPIGQIRRLHVSKGKKRWIYLSLAMGGSACLVSIIRFVFVLQLGSVDRSWTNVPAMWASEAELCVGFLVVSIPTYQPIYRRLVYGSADALEVRTGKAYKLQAESHKSKNQVSHQVKASSQATLPPIPLGISVTDDIQPVRLTQHNGSWVGIAENDVGGSRF